MSDSSVLNSTERLLNTIRGADQTPLSDRDHLNQAEQSISFNQVQKNSMTAGVMIDDGFVALVLTGISKSGHDLEVLKWAYVTIPEAMSLNHKGFPAFLRQALEDFIGRHKQTKIWTAIDTKDLKLRNITIPDLPASKIANAAVWAFKKEFETLTDEDIFDFKILEDIQVDGIKKKKIVAFSTRRQQADLLKSTFSKAGFPLTGITALPFAFYNFVHSDILPAQTPFVLTNIARHYSYIFCLSKAGILLVRSIKTGASSLIEEMVGMDAAHTDNTINIPELLEFDTQDPLFEKISPASDRLISKIARTGDYCFNHFTANQPIDAYLFFGETDGCDAFMTSAREHVSSPVSVFNPFEDASVPSTLKITAPYNPTHRNGTIPAFAIALSSNEKTPNFLHTYIHKDAREKQRKIHMGILGAVAGCALICLCSWFWLSSIEKNQHEQISVIDAQLAQFTPAVDQDMITLKIAQAQKKADLIQRYTTDFISLAVISEICSKTPETVFIASLDADFKKPAMVKKNNRRNLPPKKNRQMIITGVVKSEFTALESTLTGYIIALGDSPFFKNIVLQEKKMDAQGDESTLIFTAAMEIQ